MSLLAPWTTFFSTVAEAAATFAGLVVVAISVNLQRIIAIQHLPARALNAIASLVVVMVMALAALIPQPVAAFAIELGVAAASSWIMHMRTTRPALRGHAELGRPLHERVLMVMFGQVQLLPLTIGAVLLGLGHPSGLYWIAFTILAAMVVGMLSVWIFLVEIVRR
jgi:modulator of FtsH protease